MEESDASQMSTETNTENQQSTTAEEEQNLLDTPRRSERRLIEDEDNDDEFSANPVSLDVEANQASAIPSEESPATIFRGRTRSPEEIQQLIQIWK
jgi:hypothetical protein